jgi:hypothetical protein
MRSPLQLLEAIKRHKELFGEEPTLISVRDTYLHAYRPFFNGKLHKLCCGKGYIFNGLPFVVTTSTFVDDFMIGY